MKIGDGSAPSALLRAPVSNRGGAGFVQTFGSVQRAYRAQRPPRLYEVAERQARSRAFEARRQRLEEAARDLVETGPQAEYVRAEDRAVTDVERVATSREVVTVREVTRDATPARQESRAFASGDEVVARHKSRLHLRLGDGDTIKVRVDADGASLRELADRINQHAKNRGRVVADLVSDSDGVRLRVSTTETGSGAVLEVSKDDFKTPDGDKFRLIDSGRATSGQDEETERVTSTETVAGSVRKVRVREFETLQRVDDEAYAGAVREFASAYNSLRSFVDEEGLDVGDHAGLVGSDDRVRGVSRVLAEIADSLGGRSSSGEQSLDDIGISLDPAGRLSVDAERLHAALDRDTDSVVELLNGAEGGLGHDVLRAVTPAVEAEESDFAASFASFFDGLSGRQQRLEQRAGVLETVVASLSPPT